MIAASEIRRAAALREIERHRAARTRDMPGVADVEDEAERTAGVSPADLSADGLLRAGRLRSDGFAVADEVCSEPWGGLA